LINKDENNRKLLRIRQGKLFLGEDEVNLQTLPDSQLKKNNAQNAIISQNRKTKNNEKDETNQTGINDSLPNKDRQDNL